jgi:formate hydrogenlyase transcriptional activator
MVGSVMGERMIPDDETRRQNNAGDHSRLLLEVNNATVSHLDLRDLLSAVAPSLRRAIRFDGAGINLYDAASNQLRVHALVEMMNIEGPVAEGLLIPLDDTPAGEAFTTRRTLLLDRDALAAYPSKLVQKLVREGVRSACTAPLVVHHRALGTLDIASHRHGAFSPADAELLTQIANQLAIAVANALNYEKARAAQAQFARERDRLELLLNVNNAIVSQLDLREIFLAVSGCLRDVLHHDFAALGLLDNDQQHLCLFALDVPEDMPRDSAFLQEGIVVPIAGNVPEKVIATRAVLVREHIDLTEFPSAVTRHAYYERGIRSCCIAPLISHDRVLGVISLVSRREAAFTEEDGRLLDQIAKQIAIAVENALAYREIEALKNRLAEEKLYLEEEINTSHSFEQIIGSSKALSRVLRQVEIVAPTDSTVLIQGETGTGKELIARAIHERSQRRERTLVKLNCAAIPTGLLESELFGHEKGAFTGAIAQRLGRFEVANKGTLFLDEVGEIPLDLQPKLLRVLQEQEFERLGSVRTQRVDVRLIAATNRDLSEMVAARQFRDDLYYRLNFFPVTLPPLRERREDIPALVRYFASKFARRMKKRIEMIQAETLARLAECPWPGNIRELENFIERAVILSTGTVLEIPFAELKLPARIVSPYEAIPIPPPPIAPLPGSPPTAPRPPASMVEVEREHILRTLDDANWVIGGPSGAAARLGLKRTTLQAKMKKLGISRVSA